MTTDEQLRAFHQRVEGLEKALSGGARALHIARQAVHSKKSDGLTALREELRQEYDKLPSIAEESAEASSLRLKLEKLSERVFSLMKNGEILLNAYHPQMCGLERVPLTGLPSDLVALRLPKWHSILTKSVPQWITEGEEPLACYQQGKVPAVLGNMRWLRAEKEMMLLVRPADLGGNDAYSIVRDIQSAIDVLQNFAPVVVEVEGSWTDWANRNRTHGQLVTSRSMYALTQQNERALSYGRTPSGESAVLLIGRNRFERLREAEQKKAAAAEGRPAMVSVPETITEPEPEPEVQPEPEPERKMDAAVALTIVFSVPVTLSNSAGEELTLRAGDELTVSVDGGQQRKLQLVTNIG